MRLVVVALACAKGTDKRRHYSMVMPLHPKQLDMFDRAMISFEKHLEINAYLDQFIVSTPCVSEESTRAIARGEYYTGSEQSRLKSDTIDWIEEHAGILMGIEGPEGLREKHHGGFLAEKWRHYCDDWLICGDIQCQFGFHTKYTKYKRLGGWHVQQLVKLGAAKVIRSPFYVVLDAEVLATSWLTYSRIIEVDGRGKVLNRCCLKSECAKHKDAPPTVASLTGRWPVQFNYSMQLLGVNNVSLEDIPVASDACVLGVTPQGLKTSIVLDILKLAEAKQYGRPGYISEHEPTTAWPWWILLSRSHFTEFSLYNAFLLLNWQSVGRYYHNFEGETRATSIKGSAFADLTQASHEAVLQRATNLVKEICNRKRRRPYSFLVCHEETMLTPDECAYFAELVGMRCANLANFTPPTKYVHVPDEILE